MPRIQPIDVNQADERTRKVLDTVQKKLGRVPNIMKTMARGPAALQSYLAFSEAISGGSLKPALREQIALTIANVNECDYCAAAHGALARMAGVARDELGPNYQGHSSEPKVEAALQFARRIVERRGFVDDADLQQVRDAGYTDGQIVEIIAVAALNIFTNYFNHVARTESDFPAFEPAAATA